MMDMIVVEELPEWGDMQPASRRELKELERFVKEDMCSPGENVAAWMQICVHAFLIGWRAAREDELENIR
jgi:hypothetical protein